MNREWSASLKYAGKVKHFFKNWVLQQTHWKRKKHLHSTLKAHETHTCAARWWECWKLSVWRPIMCFVALCIPDKRVIIIPARWSWLAEIGKASMYREAIEKQVHLWTWSQRRVGLQKTGGKSPSPDPLFTGSGTRRIWLSQLLYTEPSRRLLEMIKIMLQCSFFLYIIK